MSAIVEIEESEKEWEDEILIEDYEDLLSGRCDCANGCFDCLDVSWSDFL